MRQDASMALFQYWNRLRDGRPAPKRTDIEPADIKSLLADTFILERDSAGKAVFRLAGTRLCASYGRELKGFSFPSLWRPRDQRMVSRLADGVFDLKSLLVLTYDGVSQASRKASFELVLLPLDGGVESPRCLGLASALEKPFWLGADPLVEAAIDSVRVVDPDLEPMYLKNRPSVPIPSRDMRDPPPIAQPGLPPGGRRIRHLLVLEGGRGE